MSPIGPMGPKNNIVMKDVLQFLFTLIVVLAVCFCIPAFLPAWVTDGLMLFGMVMIIILMGSNLIKDKDE